MVTQSVMDTFGSLSSVVPSANGFGYGIDQDSGVWASLTMCSTAAAGVVGMFRAWHTLRLEGEVGPSRDRLLTHAWVGLDSVQSGVSATRSAKRKTAEILGCLVAHAQPTPQVAVLDDGGVETLWLVNDCEVSLRVGADGSGCLTSYTPGTDLVEYEFDSDFDPLPSNKVDEVRWLLNNLGEQVQYRVLV